MTALYFGLRPELRLALVAALGAAVFWAMFVKMLGVSMPAGAWLRLASRMNEIAIAWKALTTTWSIPAAFFGVVWGIIGGALPGISPSIAMALLLPFTYGLEPVTAVVLLASVYVGAEYGGSIPAILIRTPGTNAAAATVIDGFEMHKQGRGGEALGISLVSGLVGGLVGLALLILLTEPLARLALAFTPPAYFAPRRARASASSPACPAARCSRA